MSSEITTLLAAWKRGERDALDSLMPLVYGQLRRIAAQQLKRERPDHSLSATAIVNEVYIRLLGQRGDNVTERREFFALAAGLVRRILVDQARRRVAAKRGGAVFRLELDENVAAAGSATLDLELLDLDAALEELATVDPRLVRIVELRFFGGLTLEEAADELELSRTTAAREWALAKSWLHRRLRGKDAPPP